MTGLWHIVGKLRSGKGIFLTWLAKQQKDNNIPVLSNYKIQFADLVEPAEILLLRIQDFIEEYNKCFLAIDQIDKIMDSRDSTTGENKIATDVIINSGKDGMTIAATSQLKSMADKRFREIADYKVICERRGITRDRNATILAHIGVPNLRAKMGLGLKTRRIRVGDICDLYDTNEKIQHDRRLKFNTWAQLLKKKDPETVQDLRNCETITEQREILYTYCGVKRSEQVAMLKALGVR